MRLLVWTGRVSEGAGWGYLEPPQTALIVLKVLCPDTEPIVFVPLRPLEIHFPLSFRCRPWCEMNHIQFEQTDYSHRLADLLELIDVDGGMVEDHGQHVADSVDCRQCHDAEDQFLFSWDGVVEDVEKHEEAHEKACYGCAD